MISRSDLIHIVVSVGTLVVSICSIVLVALRLSTTVVDPSVDTVSYYNITY